MKSKPKVMSNEQRKKNSEKLKLISAGTMLLQPTKNGLLAGVVEADEKGNIMLSEINGKQVVEVVTKPYRPKEKPERVLMNIATVNVVIE